MNSYISKMMKEQASPETINMGEALVDSLYNYSFNELKYEITFLEFGSKGCSACKRMETVMEEIRSQYPKKVNVVFYDILLPKNQKLMKYFGIAAIPTQVLLNKNGEEFFRHTGFYSQDELSRKISLTKNN
jgi:thioredoxin 1